MKYLSLLTEDEIRYICSVLPPQKILNYFNKYPKMFAKIKPGFRVKSIPKNDVGNFLFSHRKNNIISEFIDNRINDWMSEIQEHVDTHIVKGESKDSAYICALPRSYFAENLTLYFKLINEHHTEEYIVLLTSAAMAINEKIDNNKKLNEDVKSKEDNINKLQTELMITKKYSEEITEKLKIQSTEIQALKHSLSDLEKLKIVVQANVEIITSLNAKIQERDETLNELGAELTFAQNLNQQLNQQLETQSQQLEAQSQQLEAQIKTELEKLQTTKITRHKNSQKPKRPIDIEEFKDNVRDNFENIGVPVNSEYLDLLINHLSKILFQGIPIVLNRSVGATLMKCLANALIGEPYVQSLAFKKDHQIDDIDNFLSSVERMACLDNFIGNYNETELLPLFDSHRDKIIFLTVPYDRTINYVSGEFIRYAHYLNLNRIEALSKNIELSENPSTLEEAEYEPQLVNSNNRFSDFLRNQLREFGFFQGLVDQRSVAISNVHDLNCTLAFDVLPYCVDVLKISPYNTSEHFVKYAGDAGRCQYKSLFKRWFAR